MAVNGPPMAALCFMVLVKYHHGLPSSVSSEIAVCSSVMADNDSPENPGQGSRSDMELAEAPRLILTASPWKEDSGAQRR